MTTSKSATINWVYPVIVTAKFKDRKWDSRTQFLLDARGIGDFMEHITKLGWAVEMMPGAPFPMRGFSQTEAIEEALKPLFADEPPENGTDTVVRQMFPQTMDGATATVAMNEMWESMAERDAFFDKNAKPPRKKQH